MKGNLRKSKIDELLDLYNSKKMEIEERLEEFKKVLEKGDEEKIFSELALCICTPQSRASSCIKAIESLEKSKLLFYGNEKEIEKFLKGVRFPRNKARYIVEARSLFMKNGKLKLKEKILSFKNSLELRDWLVENVKGLGMKEASHFIRNIGFHGEELAVLDRHVLKNLKELGVIKEIPKSLTKKSYLEIEKKMKELSKKLGISMYELDLLMWYKETGKVLK